MRPLRRGRGGNTSACAEKRGLGNHRRPEPWKYLRVRGEEPSTLDTAVRTAEIPPRARRRGFVLRRAHSIIGNTSACAEKSANHPPALACTRKYLRVRGEETATAIGTPLAMEIPPRARRRVAHHGAAPWRPGNTSACAEKRPNQHINRGGLWKYLRVRGEESSIWSR